MEYYRLMYDKTIRVRDYRLSAKKEHNKKRKKKVNLYLNSIYVHIYVSDYIDIVYYMAHEAGRR